MDLSDFFTTKSQATDFATKLTAIIDTMYTTQFSLEKSLGEQFGIQKKDLFLKLFRENNINYTNISQLQDFLKKMQESMGSLQPVELTIAFEPTEEVLKAVSQWFFSTYNKQFLLTIRVDPAITAGAVITSSGKFKDYSVAKQFHEILIKSLTPNAVHPSTPPAPQPTQQISQNMEIGR